MFGHRGEGSGGHEMKSMINPELKLSAEKIARELHENGLTEGEVAPIGGDESGKAFALNKSSEGLLVLAEISIEDAVYFLGKKID